MLRRTFIKVTRRRRTFIKVNTSSTLLAK